MNRFQFRRRLALFSPSESEIRLDQVVGELKVVAQRLETTAVKLMDVTDRLRGEHDRRNGKADD